MAKESAHTPLDCRIVPVDCCRFTCDGSHIFIFFYFYLLVMGRAQSGAAKQMRPATDGFSTLITRWLFFFSRTGRVGHRLAGPNVLDDGWFVDLASSLSISNLVSVPLLFLFFILFPPSLVSFPFISPFAEC